MKKIISAVTLSAHKRPRFELFSRMTLGEYNKSVDDYADRLFRFVVKSINNTEEARDIVQETFARLWLKIDSVSGDKVKAYLFSTAYHLMIDMIRKEKRHIDYRNNLQENQVHQSNYSDLSEILHEAINKLPDIQRSVILMRDYEGYAYNEIAEITGLSESQVKVYIFRGRMYLKKYLGKIEAIL